MSIPMITCKRYGVWWMLWILNIWFPVCIYILTPCNLMEVKKRRMWSEVLIIPAFFPVLKLIAISLTTPQHPPLEHVWLPPTTSSIATTGDQICLWKLTQVFQISPVIRKWTCFCEPSFHLGFSFAAFSLFHLPLLALNLP